MNRLILMLGGLGFGALVGVLLVALFAPLSGPAFRQRLRASYRETLAEARTASAERQRMLEAQLTQLQGKSSPDRRPDLIG